MRTMVATTPAGDEWRVRVIWQPRWRALARRFGGWRQKRRGDGGGGGGGVDSLNLSALDSVDDLLAAIAAIVAVILLGLLFWFVLLPLLLLLVDAVVVVVLLALAIPVRVLLRRPWTVEAVPVPQGRAADRFTVQTVGWRMALSVRDEIVQKLQDGYPAPVSV